MLERAPAAGAGPSASRGKTLSEPVSYPFEALVTNLPARVDAVHVWRRYHGRTDSEDRI